MDSAQPNRIHTPTIQPMTNHGTGPFQFSCCKKLKKRKGRIQLFVFTFKSFTFRLFSVDGTRPHSFSTAQRPLIWILTCSATSWRFWAVGIDRFVLGHSAVCRMKWENWNFFVMWTVKGKIFGFFLFFRLWRGKNRRKLKNGTWLMFGRQFCKQTDVVMLIEGSFCLIKGFVKSVGTFLARESQHKDCGGL